MNKAGRLVRKFVAALDADKDAAEDFDLTAVTKASQVVDGYRALHARPLAKVNANLRYYVKKVGEEEPDVTQRLKRFATIVDKLRREPTMQLTTMEDIGGIRAILRHQSQVDQIRQDLGRAPRWTIQRVRDYVKNPKDDGYRAVHIIVQKDGGFVEIQLRTPWQDSWAQSVEQDTRRLRAGLKFGTGPDDLREYYRMVSQLFAMRERHEETADEFMEQLAVLYRATRRYFPEENSGNT